ncbi:FMN-dependent NADH-azoreductase [Amycolatopsis sp. NPDC098790]|uniref:FMN-dependent NADH-azoreductase n=1 Tax=Amycolatopsis sp. NPDC098790 TaxID=3363939 RepID=UPI0038056A99
MATLLHLDTSLWPAPASASRPVTAAFRAAWEEQHPGGTVVHRDLAADPVPHLGTAGAAAGFADPATHDPEQAAAFARRVELLEELERADVVLIGAPMYNLTIPSSLKAWLDHVVIAGRSAGPESSVAGTPVYVVASRGGSYEPGTPRAGSDYVRNYLTAVLGGTMGMEVDFIVPELTRAHLHPAMAGLVPKAEASRLKALEDAAAKGKAAARRVA